MPWEARWSPDLTGKGFVSAVVEFGVYPLGGRAPLKDY